VHRLGFTYAGFQNSSSMLTGKRIGRSARVPLIRRSGYAHLERDKACPRSPACDAAFELWA
jgi:hypothetical protein